MANELPFRCFEPSDDFSVVERATLPHWGQEATLCFLTWRTEDSLPKDVVDRWHVERCAWLRRHGIDPHGRDWRDRLSMLPPTVRREFHAKFSTRFESLLDDCLGTCPLRGPRPSGIVADSLRVFDGDRYVLTDFVVMPNHVHVLAAFPNARAMLTQCESWKRWTATRINRDLGRHGRFWQVDSFDHLVRSDDQFRFLRDYVAANPRNAGLTEDEAFVYSKEL